MLLKDRLHIKTVDFGAHERIAAGSFGTKRAGFWKKLQTFVKNLVILAH